MSIQFRNARLNRSYLTKVAAATVAAKSAAAGKPLAGQRPGEALPAGVNAAELRAARARAQAGSVLEACHPDILKAVSLLWGFPEMNDYFDRLWMADGTQDPIDPEAMSELMMLSRVHQSLVPRRPTRSMASIYGSNRLHEEPTASNDPWSDVPPRR
jgi:hypothetical protein